MMKRQHSHRRFFLQKRTVPVKVVPVVVILSIGFFILLTQCTTTTYTYAQQLHQHQNQHQNQQQILRRRKVISNTNANTDTTTNNNDTTNKETVEEINQDYFNNLIQRMKPTMLQFESIPTKTQTTSIPKQFFHLHHMKSGGTSLSSFIACGTRRLSNLYTKHSQYLQQQQEQEQEKKEEQDDQEENHPQQLQKVSYYIPSSSLSECSWRSYHNCIQQSKPSSSTTTSCYERFSKASVMNYCAPLAATNYFDWTTNSYHLLSSTTHNHNDNDNHNHHDDQNTPSVTMMRNPIDRVWSMYRFQTKSCYKCKSLSEIYKDINNPNFHNDIEYKYGTGVCLPQLSNHITRNLLMNLTIDELNYDNTTMTDEEKVKDAIYSIKHRFSVVGVIERLDETLEMIGYTFPWLHQDLRSTMDIIEEEENGFFHGWDLRNQEKYTDKDLICTFPHSNASPTNNHCGEGGTHLDLPSKPDEETKKLILENNKLDMLVYEAALEHFELQKKAMNWNSEEDMM